MSALVGDTPLVSGRERPPRLVLLFVAFAAVGVAVAGAAILVLVRHADAAHARRQAFDRAQLAAHAVLRPGLRAVDLSRPLAEAPRGELEQLFRELRASGVAGGALYREDGTLAYASRGSTTAGADSALVEQALADAAASGITTVSGTRVHRSYLRIEDRDGRAAVVRLDQDYAALESAAHASSWSVVIVVEALLVLLFLVFVPVLWRAAERVRGRLGELDRIATHDALTGLPNRLGFQRAADELIRESRTGAVLLLDLDGFSEINESLGEQWGDVLLRQVATRLRDELDPRDFLARLGNDEFGILVPEARYLDMTAVSERARKALARPFTLGDVRVAANAAVGATLAEPGVDLETLLRRAGTALSQAKEPGKSSIQIAGTEHDLRDVSRLAVVAELREAIENGDLLVYYQPQSDLCTRRIRGAEALLRWNHESDGILAAGEFISYAERSGLASDIRRFVLDTAAAQWSEWSSRGIDIELAVNLSAVDLLEVSLAEEVSEVVDRYGIPPWRLILELTERALISDEQRARRVVDRLVRLGVRVAIDDFGTGYSSLASLRRFEVQQVKLDRCLLRGVPGDAGAEAIIGGCVEIAHGVGASVVAEGVETPDQWRFVSLMGCDVAQGYLIGRPMPAEELTARLDVPNHVPLIAV